MVVRTATDVPLKDIENKQFLKNCRMFQPPSDFEMKKLGFFSQKISFMVFITGYRASREIFSLKMTSLSKKFSSFWYHFGRLANFFVVLQTSIVRSVKTRIYVRKEKKLGKTNFEKLLFYQFLILSRKNFDFPQNSKA